MTFMAACDCGFSTQGFKFSISADVVAEYHNWEKRDHQCVAIEIPDHAEDLDLRPLSACQAAS